jgi:hypothetical protein
MAGAAALEAANALVGALGGSVTIGPSGLVITIPEIEIFSKHEFPLFNLALFDQTIPLLSAGIDIGPVVLAAVLGIHIAGDVKGIVYAGPGYLRGIRIALNPISGNYSAAGTLSVGEAVSEIITLTGAGMVRGYVIVITPEGPIPIPIATVEGGLKGVIRGSALGNLANAVTLGYSGGVISFTDDITLKLGALLETDLFAFAMAKIDVLNDFVLCNYHWPLAHWETSNAEQYDVSLGISYGGGGPPITISPVSKTVIPISDIETALPPIDIERRCASVEEVVAELCKQGFIPPDICKLLGMPVPPALGPGAPAPAPPVPVVPPTPADPGILVDDCADPIGKKDLGKFNVKGRDRRVTYNDKGKHTKMAKKTIARMVAIANVKNCQADSSFSQCEKEFCEAAKAKDKTYGSQIDNVTRRIERIKDLLQQAWDKTPVPVPSSGSYDIEAEDDITVGFDMDITGSTVNYRVKTTVANGGKDFNETHLFPED